MTTEEAKKVGFRKAKHKPCDMPDEITFNGAEYRRLADNEQHKDGDIPVDGSQTHRFGSIWYHPVESHETPVGETQAKEVVTDETQHSPSRPLSDAEFKNLVGRMSLSQLYDALKANGVKLEGIGLEPKKVGNKYHRTIHGVAGGSLVVDVYNVLDAFGVTCPACQHAIKKLLCAGLRNKGSRLQDLTEAEVSVKRAVELEQQRNEGAK